jgi:hypothetical protein
MSREEVLVISSQATQLSSHQPRDLIMSYYPHNEWGYYQQIGTRTIAYDSKQSKATGHLPRRLLLLAVTPGTCLS